MRGFVQREFDPLRDAAEIDWLRSIGYNGLRAFSTAVLMCLILKVLGEPLPSPFPLYAGMHVVGYFTTALPVLLLLTAMGRWWGGLFWIARLGTFLMVSLGDPLARLCIGWTPLKDHLQHPPTFSPHPFLLVLRSSGYIMEPDDRLILTLPEEES